ncbi:MAG: 4Fe-4S binding protein [Anaerolineae bacterium]|nr:4Fe-4S binding protein [Anaerolineae bacterium]
MAMTYRASSSKTPRVDESRCRVCQKCAARAACRTKAIIALDPGEAPFVDGGRCHGCRVCMPACPFEALVI